LRNIGEQWGVDRAMLEQKEVSEREQLELSDYIERIDTQAKGLIASGVKEDYDKGMALYDGLEGTVGLARANTLKSGALYKMYDVEAAMNVEALKSTGPKEYIERTKELRKAIRDNKDLGFDHKKTLDSRLTYQVANVAASQTKEAERMEIQLSKDVISGDVNPEWKETAVAVYGEESTEQIEKILFNSLAKVGAVNKNVRKGMDMIKDMRTTPMSYTDVVKYAADNCGEYGEEIRELAAIVAAEHIQDGAALAYTKYVSPKTFPIGYASFFMVDKEERTAPYTGWVADIHDEIIEASTATDDMSVIQGYQRKLIDFYYSNKHPEQEDIDKFKYELLSEHWKKEVQNLNTPQVNIIREFATIEEAESAGLKSGTIITIGGRRARID